jgi:hypothetical protein
VIDSYPSSRVVNLPGITGSSRLDGMCAWNNLGRTTSSSPISALRPGAVFDETAFPTTTSPRSST